MAPKENLLPITQFYVSSTRFHFLFCGGLGWRLLGVYIPCLITWWGCGTWFCLF